MITQLFDAYIAVDWSARSSPSPVKPSKDAIWIGEKDSINKTQRESYWRTRSEAIHYLTERLTKHAQLNRRVLIGYDFNLGFPAGFVDAFGASS